MISKENKKIAEQAMEFALKNGAQACRINLATGSEASFELRNDQLDRLQQASENSMRIELFVDGRYSSVSSNKIIKKDIELLIKNGIASARFLAEDKFRALPDPSLYYKGGKPDLMLFDSKQDSITEDQKINLAKSVIKEVSHDRVISVSADFANGDFESYMITSNGFEGEKKSTWYSLGGSASVKGDGDARPVAYWYESSLFFDKLVKDGIGDKMLKRSLGKLGQTKVKSGKYLMLLDNLNGARLLSPIIEALSGGSIQQKNSFLIDKKGEKIGSDKFSITDNPHIVGASGAKYYDYEGIETAKRTVFTKGILDTYFIDTYNARKMDVESTISGPSILEMEHGANDFAGMLKGVKKGIYVTGFNGGNSNGTTGDFSFGVEGFFVENGELTTPIGGMNITGNLVTLWSNLIEVGNDPKLTSSYRIPALLFNDVDFSGL